MTAEPKQMQSVPLSWRAIIVYSLAAAFLCYEMALQVSPSVMTTQLMRDLSVDAAGLGIISGFYFYSYTLMQIPAGLLFDRFSTRWLTTISLLVCAAGATFFGMADSVMYASLGRFFMGLGSAFAFIGVLVVATRWFPLKYFAFLVGIAQFLAAMGAMGGEAPLASAVNKFGWRPTITWLAFAGGLLALCILFIVHHKPEGTQHSSQKSKDYGIMRSIQSVLGNLQTWWLALYAFACWAPITAFASLWGVPYLMARYNVSNTLASEAMAMVWIGLGIASPIIGWYSDQLGRRRSLLNFCALVGVIASVILLYVPTIPFALTFVLLFAFGVATAGQILSFAVVRDINRPEVTATAIGVNNMAVVAGGALFQPLVGYLLRLNWTGEIVNNVPVYSVENYTIALLVVPVCFFLSYISGQFLIRETYCKPQYTYQTNS
ncbi:MAG: MFS transporter [Gammaproteobacteria bacterium]|nr:MFS transporter [Gammaproteobacteria bacterium]